MCWEPSEERSSKIGTFVKSTVSGSDNRALGTEFFKIRFTALAEGLNIQHTEHLGTPTKCSHLAAYLLVAVAVSFNTLRTAVVHAEDPIAVCDHCTIIAADFGTGFAAVGTVTTIGFRARQKCVAVLMILQVLASPGLEGIVLVLATADNPQEELQEFVPLRQRWQYVKHIFLRLRHGGHCIAHKAIDDLLRRGRTVSKERLPDNAETSVGIVLVAAIDQHAERFDERVTLRDNLLARCLVVDGLNLVGAGMVLKEEVA